MSELTTRQWRLYDFINDQFSQDPEQWVNNDMIINNIEGYTYNEFQTEHNQTAYQQIRKDIQAMRDSEVIKITIESSPKGYRVLSRKKAKEYLTKEKIAILKRLKRINHQFEKNGLDGQVVLVEDGSKAHPVIEAFRD